MKRFFLIIIVLIPFGLSAQLVVNDPVMSGFAAKEQAEMSVQTANMVKQLSEAVQSTTELKKTTDFLKKSHERLTQVNTVITNLSRLQSLIKRQRDLIGRTSEMVSELEGSDLFTPEEINVLHRSITRGIQTTNDIVEMLDLILKPKTKMSDSERLSLLRDLEKDFSERQTLLQKNVWDYQRIKNQRLTRKALQTIHAKK